MVHSPFFPPTFAGLFEILFIDRHCEENHPPVQEGALSCLVSLTYVDRIVAPLVEAGCIPVFIARLKLSAPTAVRHVAALALLNVALHNQYKTRVVEAGGLEAAVALLGSDSPEVELNASHPRRDR